MNIFITNILRDTRFRLILINDEFINKKLILVTQQEAMNLAILLNNKERYKDYLNKIRIKYKDQEIPYSEFPSEDNIT